MPSNFKKKLALERTRMHHFRRKLLFHKHSSTTQSKLLFHKHSSTTQSKLLFHKHSSTTPSKLLFHKHSSTTQSKLLFHKHSSTTQSNVRFLYHLIAWTPPYCLQCLLQWLLMDLDATLWLAASCQFMNNIVLAQYYANKVCKNCASLTGFVALLSGRCNRVLL